MISGVTVPRLDKAVRGGFMRRFLTLVCLLCLAIPAGISISGCTRNPGASYCNGLGYGMKIGDVASLTLQPVTSGISLAYGQTRQISSPSALTCKGQQASVATFTYGTTNNQLVDISSGGNICAGTWNRNSGGGIADFTICNPPSPLPSTGGLPYGIAYVTASAQSVTSNPVEVFVHAQVTSVSLVTTPTSGSSQKCYSQGAQATLDAEACFVSNGTQYELCKPSTVTSNYACPGGLPPTPLLSASYVAGGSITGVTGQTCNLSGFNNGATGAIATVTLTGANIIASGTALNISNSGANTALPPTTATLSSGSATCSGTATISSTLTPLPNCTASVGALNYVVGNPLVANVTTNTSTNQVTITSLQPGTTAITASVAGSGSSAGFFSTCPPASISVTLANGNTTGTITQGVTQDLTTTITDTYGNPLTGVALTYQSTDPIDISANGGGAITTSFPGVASVYAVCQPPNCNSAPINEVGVFGTGLPVSSNQVTITTPGTASDYVWYAAPGQSQYVVPVELLTGTVGSTVRLPYVPNSMVMDRGGNTIYFGSPHELMAISTANNSITTQSTSVPGVVLAVAPDNSQLIINDQARQIFYLYNVSGQSYTSFGGMGTAAAWTPDAHTLYIVDSATQGAPHTDALYVYSPNTGWTTYALPCSVYNASTCPVPSTGAKSLAVTIPSVGAFISGNPTVAHTWCPSGTVGNYANMLFYPQGPFPDNSVAVQTDVLAATTDGNHMIGASTTGSSISLSDIGVTIPSLNCLPPVADPNYPLVLGDTLSPLVLQTTLSQPPAITASAAAINQVVPSPASNLAFITYTPPTTGAATGVNLPFYVPGSGALSYVTFKGSAASITAPLAGAFTPDNKLFFVSTAGDNMIHYISVPLVTTNPANADTQQISPNLPACTSIVNGGTDLGCAYSGPNPGTAIVPATAIAVKPRSTT
jgi:hypothetical protein